VVGSTMLILIALAHQSIRGHRQPGKNTEATARPLTLNMKEEN
jgi:hypothetical protein